MSDESGTAEQPESTRRNGTTRDREWRIGRGVAIRAGFYIFGTHLFAGSVWLLFYPACTQVTGKPTARLPWGEARRVIGAERPLYDHQGVGEGVDRRR